MEKNHFEFESSRLLAEFLKETPQEELQAIWKRVNAMNLGGPTLEEVLAGTEMIESLIPYHVNEANVTIARRTEAPIIDGGFGSNSFQTNVSTSYSLAA